MSQKSAPKNLEERLQLFIKSAGYRNPTLLQREALPYTLQGRDIAIEAGPGAGRTGLLIISLLMQLESRGDGLRALIVAANASEVFKVMRQYRKFSARLHGRPHIVGLGANDSVEKEIRLLSRNPDIAVGTSERIIDHLRRESIHLGQVKTVVVIVPEDFGSAGFNKDVEYIYSKLPDRFITQVFSPDFDTMSPMSELLKRPVHIAKADWQEDDSLRVSERREGKMENSDSVNTTKAEEYINTILQHIKENENPQELNEYRRIFRKNTPVHLRAYLAAYLIKEATDADQSVSSGFKTLFVSIGKNRKVFPKDFQKLFTTTLSISNSDLGEIKVLDNYSFIDIGETHAQKAIEALNATEFRGRKITVNYARKKRRKR